MRRFFVGLLSLLLAACDLFSSAPTATLVPTAPPTSAEPATATSAPSTATATTAPVEASTPTSAPQPSPAPAQQFIAYVQNGQLLVTDVTGGVKGGTTQYTQPGVDDQVTDLVWSPSGEFVAYTAPIGIDTHLFVVFAVGAGTPVDLGPGAEPAWSPDSTRLAYWREGNLWIAPVASPAPQQLTFETNWGWGRAAFTPDGGALIISGNSFDLMGASGNTGFRLERLDLASGARAPLPGMQGGEPLAGRLPRDVRFSPDGQRLAFSTSFHLSACASEAAYYVADADGGDLRTLISPSLAAALAPPNEYYHQGFSYAWSPAGDALAVTGLVRDCTFGAATEGQVLAGPQLSVLGLDGVERLIIPGEFSYVSYDRTGQFIAAARTTDPATYATSVHLYSTQTGQLVLDLGPGSNPQFQP